MLGFISRYAGSFLNDSSCDPLTNLSTCPLALHALLYLMLILSLFFTLAILARGKYTCVGYVYLSLMISPNTFLLA